jgi:hypothetical protein
MTFDEKVVWLSDRGIRYLVLPDDVIQRTPLFEYMGLKEEFESWKNAPEHFRLLEMLEMPRAREEGSERITVYEVLSPETGLE